jgi:hypothetical protein
MLLPLQVKQSKLFIWRAAYAKPGWSKISDMVVDRGGELVGDFTAILLQKPFGSSIDMWDTQCGHCGQSFRFVFFNEKGLSLSTVGRGLA